MDAQTLVANLRWGSEMLPFPVLLLYLAGIALIWLLVESILTRTARATPKWRRPFPVVGAVSEVAVWLIRASVWLIVIWVGLYAVLVGVHWYNSQNASNLAAAHDTLALVANSWRQFYANVVNLLPPALAQALPGV